MNRHAKNSEVVRFPSRRQFLQQSAMGLGSLALASMLHETSAGQDLSLARPPHFAPKARSAIWLFMSGGPRTWTRSTTSRNCNAAMGNGCLPPIGSTRNGPSSGRCFGSPFKFRQHGQSGSWVSEIFPHTAKHVDDIAFLHSSIFAKRPRPGCYRTHDRNRAARVILASVPGSPTVWGRSTRTSLRSWSCTANPSRAGNDSLWSSGFLPKSQPASDAQRPPA